MAVPQFQPTLQAVVTPLNDCMCKQLLASLGGYEPTYGGLAGTIVALFFFWTVGLGIVVGAHLNAALAETVVPEVEGVQVPDAGMRE